MIRVRVAALGLGMLLALPAYAVDVPRTTPTPDHVDIEEKHRFSIVTQGLVGAIGGGLAVAGVALLADSYVRYQVLEGGGDGNSCRPCTTSQIAGPRTELGLSIGLLAAGGVLAVVSGVMAGLDHEYVHRHDGTRTSRVQLTPQGVRF